MAFQKGQSGNPQGKPKGAISKAKRVTLKERQEILRDCEWLTPLRFLLSVMVCEDNNLKVRVDCAKAALPYIHKKMPIAIDFNDPTGTGRGGPPPLQVMFVSKLAQQGEEVLTQEAAAVEEALNRGVPEEPPAAPPATKKTKGSPAPKGRKPA